MTAWRSRIIGHGEEAPDQLLANPRNWRIHPKAQQDALAGVLDEVGWVQDIIVNQRTGHVVDGHARVAIAISRDEPTVPVVYVDLSLEEEGLILATLDPLSAMAGKDEELLRDLLASVETDSEAVQTMLAGLVTRGPAAGLTDPDDVPVVTEPISKLGDLWLLGEHRLLCGDSTKAEDVARLMGGEQAAAVLTDPPYGMNLDTDWSNARGSMRESAHGTRGNTYERVIGDADAFDPTPLFEAWGYCQEIFLFGADYYAESIPNRNAGSWLVWDKRKESQSEAIGSEFELCWSKAHHKRRMLRHDWFGFLSSANGSEARNREHPTQKPTTLIQDIIEQWIKGQIIIDPFLGSGTTLIACERLGRRCYAMEIEPRYVDVAVKRWEQFTGRNAVLESAASTNGTTRGRSTASRPTRASTGKTKASAK